MAEASTEGESSLTKGTNPIPTISMGEQGYNGLTVVGGNVLEEYQYELRFPYLVQTIKEMVKDSTIAPAVSLYGTQIARSGWKVKVPKGYEEQLKTKADYLVQVQGDMEHSWDSFIRQISSFSWFGFSICEKVFRKRYKRNGSKYDDGLVGIKKLPVRSQDSITGWEWDATGRDLTGVWQKVNRPKGKSNNYSSSLNSNRGKNEQLIPRNKFLHFKTGDYKDNPQGTSPLIPCWKPWKFKTSLEEHEILGVAQDLRGLKVIKIHSKFLNPDGADEDIKVGEYYKKIANTLHSGDQSGLVLPSDCDENGNPLFTFDVVSVMGQKAHNTNDIIQRYNTSILTALTSDFLILGQSGGGSFALSENKASVSDQAIEARLREIKDVLNHDLIPQLFKLNGWDTDVMPYFEYDPVSQVDIDTFSKGMQRLGSVGLVQLTPKAINYIAEVMGIPVEMVDSIDPYAMSPEERDKFLSLLTKYESGASEGLVDAGEGTSKGGSEKGDTSVGNNAN